MQNVVYCLVWFCFKKKNQNNNHQKKKANLSSSLLTIEIKAQ